MNRIAIASAFALILSSGCGGNAPTASPASYVPALAHGTTGAKIQNVIIVVQDERTFDNLFAGFPGANGPLYGLTHGGTRVPLRATTFYESASCFTPYGLSAFATAVDRGKMDGFDRLDAAKPLCPYTRISPSQTKSYWDLAKRYTLSDATFASTSFGDAVNRQYLISGSTQVSKGDYVIGAANSEPFGCDAPAGTRTNLLTPKGILLNRGPFPCFGYPTIAERLDEKGVSWRYYVDNAPFDAYDAIRYVREGPDWKTDVARPTTRIFSDLKNGTLAQASWMISGSQESDAPFARSAAGPAWVNSIVEAAQRSKYWQHLAIVVVWSSDGSEAFYDNAAPPVVSEMGLGLRVPMIVISPYAKRGYVSHTVYQNGGSTLRFIEETFGLKSLGASDVTANSIRDCFVR